MKRFAIALAVGIMLVAAFVQAPVPMQAPRSSQWPKVRAAHLKMFPVCAVCGTKKEIEVHHKLPFQHNPELELSPANLVSLCRDHHFLFGHLNDWQSWNADVDDDAAVWRKKIQSRPRK